MAKNMVLWLIIALVLVTVFQSFGDPRQASTQLTYSQFLDEVHARRIRSVVIEGREISAITNGDEPVKSVCQHFGG